MRSIIGGIKREGAAVKAAVADGRAVTKADVETREEKLMRARRDFEKAHGDRMRAELVEGPDDPEASIEFPPMQKVWRNILHELAGELHLHAESVELEDPTAGGDKFVVVYRKPPVVELTEAEEARRAAAARARPRGRGREARRGADGPGAQVRGGGPRPGAHRGRHGEARPARRRADHWRHAQAQARRRGAPPRKRRFPLGCPSTEVSIRVTVATEYARDQ